MAERLNTHMNVVIGPNGEARYKRNMKIKFKAKHGETGMTKEQIRAKRMKEKEREGKRVEKEKKDGRHKDKWWNISENRKGSLRGRKIGSTSEEPDST